MHELNVATAKLVAFNLRQALNQRTHKHLPKTSQVFVLKSLCTTALNFHITVTHISARFQISFVTFSQNLLASWETSSPVLLHSTLPLFHNDFTYFSIYRSYHSGLRARLLAWKPVLLIFSDTAPTPFAVSSLCSGNLSGKRRRERGSWWGLGGRLATGVKRGAENGSCQEMWRLGGAGWTPPLPPPRSVWGLCHMCYILLAVSVNVDRQACQVEWGGMSVRELKCDWIGKSIKALNTGEVGFFIDCGSRWRYV